MPNLSPHDPSGQAPPTCPRPSLHELRAMLSTLRGRHRSWGSVACLLGTTETRLGKYRRGDLYPPDSILTRILDLTKGATP